MESTAQTNMVFNPTNNTFTFSAPQTPVAPSIPVVPEVPDANVEASVDAVAAARAQAEAVLAAAKITGEAAERLLVVSQAVSETEPGKAKVRISGPMYSFYDFDPGDIAAGLDAIDDLKEIEVVLSTPGGAVFEAMAVYSDLRARARDGVDVKCVVRGVCASAGVLVLVAGDERIAGETDQIMVHAGRAGLIFFGTEGDLDAEYRRVKAALRATTVSTRKAYKRVGVEDSDVDNWLGGNADHWLSADAALEASLLTEVEELEEGEPEDDPVDGSASGPDNFTESAAENARLVAAITADRIRSQIRRAS